MAGDWIKFEIGTPDKPEVWEIAAALEIDPDAVVGKLLRVWSWFDQHTETGNARSVTKMLLDRSVGVTGFCDALIASGWMYEDQGEITLPNFERHNGKTAKKRAVTAKRVAKHKENQRPGNAESDEESNAGGVTGALPREEKRRSTTSSTTSDGRRRLRMATDWRPSDAMADRMTMAGIPPETLSPEALGEFKSYWMTRDDQLTQSQWEHKLIQALQSLRRRPHAQRTGTGNQDGDRDSVREALSDVDDRSWAAGLG